MSRIVKDGGARLDVIGERPAGRFKASDRLGETVGGKGASLCRVAFVRVEHRAKDSSKRLRVIDR